MDVNQLYSELLIEYSKDKSFCHEISEPDFEEELLNPLCGDKIKVFGRLTEGKLTDVAYHGQGCAISQAAAAIICGLIKDKDIATARGLLRRFEDMINGQEVDLSLLGDAKILAGIAKIPGRKRCALLACENLKKGLNVF